MVAREERSPDSSAIDRLGLSRRSASRYGRGMKTLFAAVLTGLLALAALPLPADLELAWSQRPEGAGPWRLHPLGAQLLVESADGSVTALDAEGGQVRWRLDLDAPLSQPPKLSGARAVLVAGRQLAVVDATSGSVLDRRTLPSGAATAPVLAHDRLVVATHAGRLHVFTLGGRELWSRRQPEGFGASLSVHLRPESSLVLLTNGQGRLAALDVAGSKPSGPVWLLDLGAEPVGRAQLGADGWWVAALQDGQLVCVSADSGRARWRSALKGLPGAPALRADGLVLVGGGFGMSAHDIATGRVLWEVPTPALPRGVAGGAVLALGENDTTRLLRWDDGHEQSTGEAAPRLSAGSRLVGWRGAELVAWVGPERPSAVRRAAGVN